MFGRRTPRLTVSLLMVLSLLFSQLALASYVCPEPQYEAAAAIASMDMAPGEPCKGAETAGMQPDKNQPVLCHQHFVNAAQTFEPLTLPHVAPAAIVQVLVTPLLLGAEVVQLPAFAGAAQPRPPPDPLFLSTLRLRV